MFSKVIQFYIYIYPFSDDFVIGYYKVSNAGLCTYNWDFLKFIIDLFSAVLGSWVALREFSLVVGVQAYHCGGSPFPK